MKILISLAILLAFGAKAGAEEANHPNIVLIMIDDLAWMDLSCQGNPHLDTPAIDAFAKQGLRFTDAYAAAPVCSNRLGGAIRKGDYKLVHWYDGKQEVELYNLKKALGETNDLSRKMPERAAEMKRELLEWLRKTGAEMPRKATGN